MSACHVSCFFVGADTAPRWAFAASTPLYGKRLKIVGVRRSEKSALNAGDAHIRKILDFGI